jgi:hypothetical protein
MSTALVHVHVYGMWELEYLKRNLDIRGVWKGRDPENPDHELVQVLLVGRGNEWRGFASKGVTFSLPTNRLVIVDESQHLPGCTPYSEEVSALMASIRAMPEWKQPRDGPKFDPGRGFAQGA